MFLAGGSAHFLSDNPPRRTRHLKHENKPKRIRHLSRNNGKMSRRNEAGDKNPQMKIRPENPIGVRKREREGERDMQNPKSSPMKMKI